MEGYLKKWNSKEVTQLSPLTLAYIGDAVFELIVRVNILDEKNKPVKNLHAGTVDLVQAPSQAEIFNVLENELTEEETLIVRRAKNAKVANLPSGSSLLEYRKATALEALCGYLYLSGRYDRLFSLLTAAGTFEENNN